MQGKKLDKANKYRAAVDSYTAAIKANPAKAKYFAARATMYTKLHMLDEGIIDFRKALTLDPKVVVNFEDYATCLLSDGNWDEVVKICTLALAQTPANFRFYQLRAQALSFQHKPEAALKDLDQAIRLKPTEAQLYQQRGKELQAEKKYVPAIADYTKEMLLNGPNEVHKAQSLITRGRCYLSLNKLKLAEADFSASIRLAKNRYLAQAYEWRAKIYEKEGQPKLAQKDREFAVQAINNFQL